MQPYANAFCKFQQLENKMESCPSPHACNGKSSLPADVWMVFCVFVCVCVCLCISRRSDIHTNTTVTLNVVHTGLRSCVVGRVFTGIQMGFYKRILETLFYF